MFNYCRFFWRRFNLGKVLTQYYSPNVNPNLLQRSEVVALINTAHRLSESLHAVDEFRRLWAIAENREVILKNVEENIKVCFHFIFSSSERH